MPAQALNRIPTTPGEASRRGVLYEVANGERIANLGEKCFSGSTHHEGINRLIRAQVCDVSKLLMSVAELVKAGNTVVFSRGQGGSFVVNDMTGRKIPLVEEKGTFVMEVEYLEPDTGAACTAGFVGQGK